jgi:hypothetical protein
LFVNKQGIRELGITWKLFFDTTGEFFNADTLIVESSYHGKRWNSEPKKIMSQFELFRCAFDNLFYLDTSDSTALLHPELLPVVDKYLKGQMLVDKSRYLEAQYGRRVFTDFVHSQFGIMDNAPEYSRPVANESDLEKLHVLWNSSLANWSYSGRYFDLLFSITKSNGLFLKAKKFCSPLVRRDCPISYRMNSSYARETIAWHRQEPIKILDRHKEAFGAIDVSRLSYHKYRAEMKISKLIFSPFGWGEINYRDFEGILSGGALVKPDMSHLQTWPELYVEGETYLNYGWNLKNISSVVEWGLSNEANTQSIAAAAQQIYQRYLCGPDSQTLFCNRFASILLN